MRTITTQSTFYHAADENRESILDKFIKAYAEAFHENKAYIICGISMMSGNAHVYPLY